MEEEKRDIYKIWMSDSIANISPALCQFQKEVGKIKKKANNPFFKSKYATLADILDVIQEPLSEAGLVITQHPIGTNELQTMLIHSSGEFMASSYTMAPVKNDPQSIGSCITYQRRYAIGAILCLNIDDDDDGNKANGNTMEKPRQKPSNKTILTEATLSTEKLQKLCAWIATKEQSKKASGERFSLATLIEGAYQVTNKEIEIISKAYNEFKKS